MSLGSTAYTIPNGTISNAMLTGDITLNKLSNTLYESLAVADTLVFRDAENLTEMHELRVTNLLTVTGISNATDTPTSTVSRANQINLISDTLDTSNPMVQLDFL